MFSSVHPKETQFSMGILINPGMLLKKTGGKREYLEKD